MMKTKLFFILIAGFAFSVLSCNSDSDGTTKEDKTTGTLYAMGTRVESESANSDKPYPDPGEYDPNTPHKPIVVYPSLELVFTGDDIKSFNITTGEIVFTDLIIKKLTTPTEEGVYRKLSLYYDDKPLFEEVELLNLASSRLINDLVFVQYGVKYESEFYLVDGYPSLTEWNEETKKETQKERDENFKKRKAEWDIFIKYLRDAGKIVE
jgi:hypothetical protein